MIDTRGGWPQTSDSDPGADTRSARLRRWAWRHSAPIAVMPSLFFIGVGAVLGAHRIMAVRQAAEPAAEPATATGPATAAEVPTADAGPATGQAS
ncbi:hypothetical protein ACIBF5_08395 [Micromonospora sp. NPDC050417]|uniref:hypothetical protein n=1 Tax=Micromonospora sp. NPDC050417 TaxID=3364280 RepID=UPI0037BC7FDE